MYDLKFIYFFVCFPEADYLRADSPISEEHGLFEDEIPQETDSDGAEQFFSAPEQAEVENEFDDMGEAIVKCIFESLDIIQDTGASLNTFQDLLVFARHMFCRGRGLEDEDQMIKSIWPHDWETARQYLLKLGYQDAREYFICLDDSHKRHWDILERPTDTCCHCCKPGQLKYYYLGLKGKVKQWVASPEMCRKMTAHWQEKEHWLGRERGWHIKKEVWDGDRFCKLSWFWDPNAVWCLPAKCKTENCKNVFNGEAIERLPATAEGLKEVSCQKCHKKFLHEPKYARGDPRNLALMGKKFISLRKCLVWVLQN